MTGMSKPTTLQIKVIKFLKRYQKKWVKYCDVADSEGMPNMKAFYSKRVNAAKLIIDTLDTSPKSQGT